jgi:hypothetical protein
MQLPVPPVMNIRDKRVTKIPLETLWTGTQELDFVRQNYLTGEDIRKLFKAAPVQLVIADVGRKLQWIPIENSFERFKRDIKEHIADNLENIDLDKFKDNFAYIASVWNDKLNNEVVVLERCH